ncbi:MAG: lactate utilization protein [Planctomycetia bacterium]|nr:lactate utilization protein [Planctomycetia bacterium]
MNSRDTVLGRIRNALADRPVEELPPVPEVWPETNPDAETMAARFAQELDAVQGELHRCRSMDDARAKLRGLMKEFGASAIGAIDGPVAREVTEGLNGVAWVAGDWDPNRIGQLPLGLVAADYLLADTGTCVVANGTSQERLMCYLPPACIVIAKTDRLREHLPAAWKEIGPRAADPALCGEFVFITGPSRTADIEKILILGVHGPKRLIVLLVG